MPVFEHKIPFRKGLPPIRQNCPSPRVNIGSGSDACVPQDLLHDLHGSVPLPMFVALFESSRVSSGFRACPQRVESLPLRRKSRMSMNAFPNLCLGLHRSPPGL